MDANIQMTLFRSDTDFNGEKYQNDWLCHKIVAYSSLMFLMQILNGVLWLLKMDKNIR